MDTVKTYIQVNQLNENLSFGISKMEDIYSKRKGQADTPHRHNFYTIIITTKAEGSHFIDFKEYPLKPNQVFFIAPNQVHQIIEKKEPIGYSITFSNQFLVKNNIPLFFIENLNLFNDFSENPPIELNRKELEKLTEYVNEIHQINKSNITFKYEAIGALLKFILILCNNFCSHNKEIAQTIDSNNSTLHQFKVLIDKYHKEWHATNKYAKQLYITPDHLNRIVKMQTGKTAKEHIQSRIIIAAKRLLYFTELSNKEIGFELGFSEPANFSAFFKKCTGLPPLKFKQKELCI
jgi:AraC family transcriptional regulator, transcriptional activator of pobA